VCVRTIRGRRPDGWSRIVSYHIRCTSVRTTAVRCPYGSFWTAILALWRYASGRYTTSSGQLIDLPFLGTWKESVNRSRTNRRPDVPLKRPDGASWHRNYSIQWSVRTEEARRPDGWCWTVWRPDGMTHSPNGWSSRQMGVRTGWHIVGTADRELWNSSEFTLNSGIPVCSILTYKWFCPNTEWGQNTNTSILNSWLLHAYRPLFIGFRRPFTILIRSSLGHVWTESEGVWMVTSCFCVRKWILKFLELCRASGRVHFCPDARPSECSCCSIFY